jgi:ABC-type Zn uptake system ZnuABC Zn-binding protein ZnuA
MRTILISICLSAGLALTACGSDDESGAGLHVVATTGIAADLAENVAGPRVELEQIVPDSASPHDFQLSAVERQRLEDADLVVSIGSGLEPGIPLDEVDAPQWALTEHVDAPLPEDPHVWMDPTRVAASLPSLAEVLGEVDSPNAGAYRTSASEYADELRDLDAELEQTLAVVPAADRELVTSHDSLGYLADRYGFDVVATAFPASGPEAEASAAALREVTDAIRESGVPAVFAQADDDPEALSTVAEEAGVEIEEGLLVESPGDAGSYIEMLRRDASLISAALGGS